MFHHQSACFSCFAVAAAHKRWGGAFYLFFWLFWDFKFPSGPNTPPFLIFTHQLRPRTPRWPSSTCSTALCPTRSGLWTRTPGRGWCRSCLGCPPTGVSIVSGCEGLPGRCKWTGPRWRRSCARGRTRPPRPTPTGRRLQTHKVTRRGEHDKWPTTDSATIFLLLILLQVRFDEVMLTSPRGLEAVE